jgi:hypothetical protein
MGWLPLAISMGLMWRVKDSQQRRRKEVRA